MNTNVDQAYREAQLMFFFITDLVPTVTVECSVNLRRHELDFFIGNYAIHVRIDASLYSAGSPRVRWVVDDRTPTLLYPHSLRRLAEGNAELSGIDWRDTARKIVHDWQRVFLADRSNYTGVLRSQVISQGD